MNSNALEHSQSEKGQPEKGVQGTHRWLPGQWKWRSKVLEHEVQGFKCYLRVEHIQTKDQRKDCKQGLREVLSGQLVWYTEDQKQKQRAVTPRIRHWSMRLGPGLRGPGLPGEREAGRGAHQRRARTAASRWLLCDSAETGSSCGQRRAPTLHWDLTGDGGHLHKRDNLANKSVPCQNPKSHFPFRQFTEILHHLTVTVNQSIREDGILFDLARLCPLG